MDSESSIHQETLYGDDEGPSGRRRYDSYTRKPEWISYGLLALLYVLILALFITVYSIDDDPRKHLVTLQEMNDFRERVHNLSSAMEDLHTSVKEKTCEEGWKQLDDSCYFLTVVKAPWSKTRNICLQKGADLAVITSEREQIFLTTISSASTYKRVWIGLHDMDKEETWIWVDGTNYETGYKHWAKGQPDDNTEDCVHLWTFGAWNDLPCSSVHASGVCEKKL